MATPHLAHFISTAFCIVASILVACQVYRNPNKLRLFVLIYSISALPSSILNTLSSENQSLAKANTLIFVILSAIKVSTHFLMIITVGSKLRADNMYWRHPLVLIGAIFLLLTLAALMTQIITIAPQTVFSEDRVLLISFVIGLICAILADVAAFTYTFLPLIEWKKEKRSTEGLSKTTALGIWFFVTQCTFYIIQVVVYIWFISSGNWDYFTTLLAIDYVIRYIQYLFYIWPPPQNLIDYLGTKLFSASVHSSVEIIDRPTNKCNTFLSSERYTKATHVDYESRVDDVENRMPSYDTNKYESNVTIIRNS